MTRNKLKRGPISLLSGISEGDWKANSPYVDDYGETIIQIEASNVMVGEVYACDESEGIANARVIAEAPRVIEAAAAVLEWYDRDGSVGGAVDPMEELRDLLSGRDRSCDQARNLLTTTHPSNSEAGSHPVGNGKCM